MGETKQVERSSTSWGQCCEMRAVIQQGGCRSISAGSGGTKSPGLVPAKWLA